MSTDLLNIRSEPSTAGQILDTASTGETFSVVGESDDGVWLQLAENGAPIGWAAAEFMTVEERVAGTQPAPSGEAVATQPHAAARELLPRPRHPPLKGTSGTLEAMKVLAIESSSRFSSMFLTDSRSSSSSWSAFDGFRE